MRTTTLFVLAPLLLAPLSCSFVDSSGSISKSVSSPFKSSSSSSPGDNEQAYRNDVADYTYAYVISSGSYDTFWSGVSKIAEKRGISNWEQESATFVGIGEGAGRANLKPAELDVLKTNLTGNDSKKMQAIQRGYDSVRSK